MHSLNKSSIWSEESWIEFNEDRSAERSLRTGVYIVQIKEGMGTGYVEVHLTPTGWTTPDGEKYSSAFDGFLRCRRTGELPERGM